MEEYSIVEMKTLEKMLQIEEKELKRNLLLLAGKLLVVRLSVSGDEYFAAAEHSFIPLEYVEKEINAKVVSKNEFAEIAQERNIYYNDNYDNFYLHGAMLKFTLHNTTTLLGVAIKE